MNNLVYNRVENYAKSAKKLATLLTGPFNFAFFSLIGALYRVTFLLFLHIVFPTNFWISKVALGRQKVHLLPLHTLLSNSFLRSDLLSLTTLLSRIGRFIRLLCRRTIYREFILIQLSWATLSRGRLFKKHGR